MKKKISPESSRNENTCMSQYNPEHTPPFQVAAKTAEDHQQTTDVTLTS